MSAGLAQALAEAERRDGPLGLSLAQLEPQVRERLAARLAPLGQVLDAARMEALLARSAAADLLLVRAARAGSAAAQAALEGRVRRELEALALKRGVVAGRVARSAHDALEAVRAPGAQAAPGAPALLEAYDGACSLLAFLALPLEERIQDDARQPAPGEPAAPPHPQAGPHPPATLLGGLAEGRLLEEERRAVQAHRDGCARCDGLLRGLAFAGLKPSGAPLPPLPGRPPRPAAPGEAADAAEALEAARAAPVPAGRKALALLLALGVVGCVLGLAFAWRGPPLEERVRRHHDSEGLVREMAARLLQEDPALFTLLEPFARASLEGEAATPVEPPAGLTPRLVHPLGETLSPTPVFAWQAAAGVRRHLLTLRDEQGSVLWRGATEASFLAWPQGVVPLERGAPASWTLEPLEPAGPAAEASFRAGPEGPALHWRRRVERAEQLLPDVPARGVLLATLALRHGHVAEGWLLLRAARERDPADPYAALLAQHVTRVHGFP